MSIDPHTTAIVAMDFQPSILRSLEDATPLLVNVARAITATRDAGGRLAFVRLALTAEEIDAFPAHSIMGQRLRGAAGLFAPEASGTSIVPQLGKRIGDPEVRKTRVGPFLQTTLHQQLQGSGISTIVFAGVQTSGCVLSGVRAAHDLDYRVIVLSNGCADPDAAVHAFLMNTIFPKQATVMTVNEYGETLAATRGVARP
jgi:nicotinamidase-related amidase